MPTVDFLLHEKEQQHKREEDARKAEQVRRTFGAARESLRGWAQFVGGTAQGYSETANLVERRHATRQTEVLRDIGWPEGEPVSGPAWEALGADPELRDLSQLYAILINDVSNVRKVGVPILRDLVGDEFSDPALLASIVVTGGLTAGPRATFSALLKSIGASAGAGAVGEKVAGETGKTVGQWTGFLGGPFLRPERTVAQLLSAHKEAATVKKTAALLEKAPALRPTGYYEFLLPTEELAVADATSKGARWLATLGRMIKSATPGRKPVLRVLNPKQYFSEVNPGGAETKIISSNERLVAQTHDLDSFMDVMTRMEQKEFALELRGGRYFIKNWAKEPPAALSRDVMAVGNNPSRYAPYLTGGQQRYFNEWYKFRDASNVWAKSRGVNPSEYFSAANEQYLPELVVEYHGKDVLARAYRENILGKSGHFRERVFQDAAERAANGEELVYALPSQAFHSRITGMNHLVWWRELQGILKTSGQTPLDRALKAAPGLVKHYKGAVRATWKTRNAVRSAQRGLNRFVINRTPQGMYTPKLKKPSAAFVRGVEQRTLKISDAQAKYAAAKVELDRVRPRYRQLMDQARRPKPGEASLIDLKMGNRIFDENFAKGIRNLLGANRGVAAQVAKGVATINNLFRPVMAAGDLSWWMIQGLLGVGGMEPAFVKGFYYGYGSLSAPDLYFARVATYRSSGLLSRYFKAGGVWYGTDIPREIPIKLPPGVKQIEKVLGYPIRTLAEGFNRSSNIARAELFKSWTSLSDDVFALDAANAARIATGEVSALSPRMSGVLRGLSNDMGKATKLPAGRLPAQVGYKAASPGGKPIPAGASREAIDREIAAVVNKSAGTINYTSLGISPFQANVESMGFFAPRYTRAFLGLLSDAMQGGMRGNRARYHLGRGILGLVTEYFGIAKAVGQEPDLDPRSARFFTLEALGAHVGVGGGYYGLIRMIGNATKAKDYNQWLDMNDNPFTRWMRGRASPVLSLIWDTVINTAVEGRPRNYLGEPLDSPLKIAQHIGTTPLPFALQSLIEENPGSALATFMGARAYPVLAWEWRDHYRDKGTQKLFPGKQWGELNRNDQKRVYEETDEGKEAFRWQEKWRKIAANQGRDWAIRERAYADFRAEKARSLSRTLIAWSKGDAKLEDVVKARQDIGTEMRSRREQLEKQYGEGEEPDQFLEDNLADLYLYYDADLNTDGVVSAEEWRMYDAFREVLTARAEEHGIDLPEYALKRSGVFWGHALLDGFERAYQESRSQRDRYYDIPRWSGYNRVDSEKIDRYLELIPTYAETLTRTALAKGYPETFANVSETVARQILAHNPPKGLTEREKQLFQLALAVHADKDLREKLENPARYRFLLDHPGLAQWFPTITLTLSRLERARLPQVGDTVESILAETRVTTDVQTLETLLNELEQAEEKAKKR